MSVEIVGLTSIGEIEPGDDLGLILSDALRALGPGESDVLTVTSKMVSKAEGRLVRGADRDEVIALQTDRVVARRGDLVIARTHGGFVCANAGVDESNMGGGALVLLPQDPDASADRIRGGLTRALGVAPVVVITDTF